jgi:hypothetical protein
VLDMALELGRDYRTDEVHWVEIGEALGIPADQVRHYIARLRGKGADLWPVRQPAQTIEPATPRPEWGRYRNVGYLWLPAGPGIGDGADLYRRWQPEGAPAFSRDPLV